MHEKTFATINSLTQSYLDGLGQLRDSLIAQLAEVDKQIATCRDFANPDVVQPNTQVNPAPKPEAQEYRDPKFLQTWKKDSGGTLQNEAEVKRNVEGRPILSDEDLKRLETAVAGA